MLRKYVASMRGTYALLASEQERFALARSLTSARSLTWSPNDLALAQYENGLCHRMDLFVRLLAIEQWAGRNAFGFDLYDRFIGSKSGAQGRSVPSHTLDAFVRLIESVGTSGFAPRGRIAIGSNKVLHHGVHRLACALFFDLPTVPVLIEPNRAARPDYTVARLRKLGLSQDDLEAVRETESRYASKWRASLAA